MSSEFWGMTAFFITTIIFSTTTLIYAKRLNKANKLLRELLEEKWKRIIGITK